MGLVLGTHTICSMMCFFHGLWTRVVRFYAFSGLDLGFIRCGDPQRGDPQKWGGPTIVGPRDPQLWVPKCFETRKWVHGKSLVEADLPIVDKCWEECCREVLERCVVGKCWRRVL